jgi:hypothetical protein
LEEHQQVFDEHPEGDDGVLVPQIVVKELPSTRVHRSTVRVKNRDHSPGTQSAPSALAAPA